MIGLKPGIEPPRGLDVGDWVLRIGVALAFVAFGLEKLSPSSPWTALFARIGLGQWFRYLTGAVQIAGAILLVLPRTALAGAALLACTMIGAIAAHVFLLREPFSSLVPAILLGLIVAAAFKRRF